MTNPNDDTKKLVAGLLIGAIGAGVLYYMYLEHNRKTPILKKIGRTIADVGEMIETCDLDTVNDYAERIEKKLPQGADAVETVSDWVSKGLTLWKKINK